MVQDDKPMPFAGSLTQTDGNDIFTKECRHFRIIPPNSKFTKAEGFLYTGPDHFFWHSVFYVSQRAASQATFSHIPGNPSSLSFSYDFGGKLYSAIDRKLNLCTATIYQIVKILIVCGDARVSDEHYYRDYPKFSKHGVKVKFQSPAQAIRFHNMFQTYKSFN